MKKMKTLKIKDTSYEVVDDAARTDIGELKQTLVHYLKYKNKNGVRKH